jgi:phage terminase large subunit-like protein
LPVARKADRFISLGLQLVDWYEWYLCHGPGDIRGEPIVLDDEFAAFVVKAYELDASGRRKVNRAFISRSKGRAKSELAAMIVCGELLGPVRFSHWAARGEVSAWGYAYEEGEPVGRSVRDPFIRCLATEEGQAGNTYDGVQIMLEHICENFADDFPKIDVGLTRVFVAGGGEVRPSTSASASKDGGNETFAVGAATHLWCLPDQRSMHDTVTRNLVKRKIAEPWMLETSTMYQPGQDSVAEATHDYWREIKAGRIKNRGILFDHAQGDIPEDWDDDEAMLAGLRQAYGAAGAWMDLDRILAEIRDPKTTRAAASRYFLNRAVAEEVRWVSPALWNPRFAEVELPAKIPVALGFDGGESDDNTALIGVTMSDPPHFFTLGVWKAPEGAEDWHVPRDVVDATVRAAFETYEVSMLLADPPYWRDELAKWIAEFGEKRVGLWPTFSWSRHSRAIDRMDTLIKTAQFSHDGDPDLCEHILNCHKAWVNPRRHELGFVVVKDRKNSPRKIDVAQAAILALQARGLAIENGWEPPVDEEVVPWAMWS